MHNLRINPFVKILSERP